MRGKVKGKSDELRERGGGEEDERMTYEKYEKVVKGVRQGVGSAWGSERELEGCGFTERKRSAEVSIK